MNLAEIFRLFCHHILPVCKWFPCQIYFLYFNKAIKAVMDVARAITAGPLCPGKSVNIWFYNFAVHMHASTECTFR